LSGRGLCDELITRPEESYRLCCVVVCDLETSRMGVPYIYDISHLRVNLNSCYFTDCLCILQCSYWIHGSTRRYNESLSVWYTVDELNTNVLFRLLRRNGKVLTYVITTTKELPAISHFLSIN